MNFHCFSWGLERIFNSSIPKSSYFPSKEPTKKICIIDSGFWTDHPDLTNVIVTPADANQTMADMQQDTCNDHGTVRSWRQGQAAM